MYAPLYLGIHEFTFGHLFAEILDDEVAAVVGRSGVGLEVGLFLKSLQSVVTLCHIVDGDKAVAAFRIDGLSVDGGLAQLEMLVIDKLDAKARARLFR